ncbi:DUF3344 domain-containing protein [uncultured Methanobrevibacter sp.]|uniref:DUF3344 domain-containing protein n=1 Tax=uncultured Methanobrevibacter sp. TaxID=253161 RepID=UPI002612077B|nr:DUF3344 domain-containing protein [uncultured Methanobrevibacter sp.]
MIVFSLGAVSADDLQSTDSDVVSGDVDVATANPWTTSGQLTYDVPSDAKEIKHADLYVNVYAGSAKNTYGANANVSINTTAGEKQIASEQLWIEDGSADGTIYTVNDHINKCYSDYQMYYDLTDTFKGLNGSSVVIKVDTFSMENKSFDGRIKLIALILAYDDGDNDTISYWVDSTQKWTKTNVTTVFPTDASFDIAEADLINIALSSGDGTYMLNGELLGDAANHTSGNYYQYNYWNVTGKVKDYTSTELISTNAGTGTYASLKNVLSVLRLKSNRIAGEATLATEYTNTCFAGTVNVITSDVKADMAANYTVELLADGKVVNSTVIALDGANKTTVMLTDPTVRPVDETTVSGANNTKVNYAVNVKYGSDIVGEISKEVPVLYNGYLQKDMAYNATYIEDITKITVTGGFMFDVQEDSTYIGAAVTNRTDVWEIDLDENSTFANTLVYIAYNWDKSGVNGPVFNVTFNGKVITPKAQYRDQSNMGSSGKYGYGLFVYDVSDIVQNGTNTMVLQKPKGLTAVYPSNLIYFWNSTDSNIVVTAYIANGADLLAGSSYNKAGRLVKSDSQISIDTANIYYGELIVFAAGAQKGEGNIIYNGVENVNVWNDTSNSLSFVYYVFNETAPEINNISFVATGSTILALNQMIFTAKENVAADVSLATEYANTCFAGTVNVVTIDVKANKPTNYTVELLADGGVVNSTVVALDGANKTTVMLTDPTVRPVDETTVSGANNTKVNYAVNVKYGEELVGETSITVPVLYNGYLEKDMAYNATYIEDISVIQFTGGMKIDTQDVSTYAAGSALNRTDVWKIDMGDSVLTKALLYLAYNWDKSGVNGPIFNATFNGNVITPKVQYRDQSNLGSSGIYGYGLFVFDVTDLIQNGNNTLVIDKPKGLTAFYPSNMIYFLNETGSKYIFTAYMADGADLLAGSSYNKAGRIVSSDSQIAIDTKDVSIYKAIIFAAGAQKGEGNIILDGEEFIDEWNGSSNSLDYVSYETDNASDVVNISFVATGSTILALNQMIITAQKVTESRFDDMTINGNGTISAALLNGNGKPIANEKIVYKVNGVENTTTTDENGVFSIDAGSNALVEFGFAGSKINTPVNSSIVLKDIAPKRVATVIEGNNYTQNAVEYNAGERGGNFTVQLKDVSGKPLANKTVLIGYNGKCLERFTDENGYASVQINLAAENRLTFAVAFLGDEGYDASMSVYLITITKKPVTITAPNKSYKASAKTKSYTVTLSTVKGADGKTYFGAGKKVTLKVDGKTITAKTNDKGQATFKLSLTKKGSYKATVSYAGDNTYKSATKTATIKIN